MTPRPPQQGHHAPSSGGDDASPPPPTGNWDWATMALTSVAGAAIVGLTLLQLTGSPPGAAVAALIGGGAIGLLTGYRPLHEDDAALIDTPRRSSSRRSSSHRSSSHRRSPHPSDSH